MEKVLGIIHVDYVMAELCCEYSMLYDSRRFIYAGTTEEEEEEEGPSYGSTLTA